MNLKELKEEFSKYCHPSWIELLDRWNLWWLNRENYISLIDRIEIIQTFRKQYELEINKVAFAFKEKERSFEQKREEMTRNAYMLAAILIVVIFFISWYFLENFIIRWVISFILWTILVWLYNDQDNYKIYNDERREYDWILLKPIWELESICEEYIKSISKELKELEKKETNEYIQNMNPYEFEKLVAKIFTYFWYATKVTKWSWDKWIDINIEKSWEKQIIQCKRYKKKIWTPVVRDFLGTMQLSWIHMWFIVTTSAFSYEVVNLLNNWAYSIKLIDIDIILVLFRIMNDWMKDEDLLEIVDIWMKWIEKKAGDAEWNNLLAKLKYKRSPYLWKKR